MSKTIKSAEVKRLIKEASKWLTNIEKELESPGDTNQEWIETNVMLIKEALKDADALL